MKRRGELSLEAILALGILCVVTVWATAFVAIGVISQPRPKHHHSKNACSCGTCSCTGGACKCNKQAVSK